ncbi:phosphoserine phosphatase-like protein [Dothidotthia symphoricarpi CBS 119687]|uniref:phosphoserine phosphatase n=1 Tax=Dothidotthia symphoricarpi CBS 119687 TaxID=1392245 RepID=A0A6A6A3I6_9PLEO|nr:phosphoserine phosphatase-like protein [Dothidotthia symphoricarpi CBS 119687]KAF2125713.1 phosphoserine phosphatase-like protein [Dothidotthia symphoricarpi CBS 119687]
MDTEPPTAFDVVPTHLVATLFYKAPTPDVVPASPNELSNGTAPTGKLEEQPLEPSHVSQSCLSDFFVTLTNIISGLQQETIQSRKLQSRKLCRVVETTFPLPSTSTLNLDTLRRHEAVSQFEKKWSVECVFQADTIYRRHKRLAVFDMDSTLIQQEVIDEIASLIGVEKEVSAITAAAMNGELDFEASLRARCRLLKGVPSSVFETLKPRITLNPGVNDLIVALKRLGFKTAVLSGGFTPLTGWMGARLGLDYAFANHLVVSADGQHLTGELTGEIVHAEKKRQHVLEIASQEEILLEQVICIGDGANDLPMMGVAGLGVAFHAKPKVQLQAPARLNSKSMMDVLYLFGVTEAEQEMLLR